MIIKKAVSKILRELKGIYLDRRTVKYLTGVSAECKEKNTEMKVAFIVFEPETWDKESPVYDELKRRGMNPDLIIVPAYDRELKLTKVYGAELTFFKDYDSNALCAYDKNGEIIDLKSKNYDYVFFQDPYNAHMPPKLRSDYVVKFAKVCYIPYGYSGSDVFNAGNTNKDFFRNVSIGFLATPEEINILKERYHQNCNRGIQTFVNMGYPSLEEYANAKWDNNSSCILWTPRWSYAPRIGGSHFLEYKDKYIELISLLKDFKGIFRPHPMMFSNFINEGRITEEQRDDYIKKLDESGIELSLGQALKDDFYRSSILLTDYSSIIPMYFLTGKPVIYCMADIPFNSIYKELEPGIYMAENWDDIQKYVKSIQAGNDYLKKIRRKIIEQMKCRHMGSAKKIVDYLIEDYKKQKACFE